MLCYGSSLTKKYAWEVSAFNFIRSFKDGVSFVEVKLNLDLYQDADNHSPKFEFFVMVFNTVLIEFQIYRT